MRMNLAGTWKIRLDREDVGLKEHWEREDLCQNGDIELPGILQSQGYGDDIQTNTPWVSSLHDPYWYVREEYKYAQEEKCNIPFLSQPPKHYTGKAWYQKEIVVDNDALDDVILRIEITHWKTMVWLDGEYKGEDFSLCAAHEILIGRIPSGNHKLTVCIDNSFQYPYRPDGHGVSDALGAAWNGMAGEILLISHSGVEERKKLAMEYAADHPRTIEVKDGMFYVDGKAEYFRGTHFGGDYPMTGYPSVDKKWWTHVIDIIKEWGFNFIRCHSCCLPEAAFLAADEAGIYIQVECGMWNVFNKDIPMLDLLRKETRKILRQFGHHPSFVLFSPSNEPGGDWYDPLKEWVKETREYDAELGYLQRRVYTAQSGWFYDTAPKDITGTDYIYFHRSGYGPILGGNIRNHEGWKGKDYRSSLEGANLPVICHEMGQWCSYPDFSVIDKFTGYLEPGNYQVFKESARQHGLLHKNREYAYSSGKNQVLMYKEEMEANFRTPKIFGFEMLDLHDYLGQGTALIGVLDPFWENKGYVMPQEWKQFCDETVLLARIPSYVFRSTESVRIPMEVCHFGKEPMKDVTLTWNLKDRDKIMLSGEFHRDLVPIGKNVEFGEAEIYFSTVEKNRKLTLELEMEGKYNSWDLYIYKEKKQEKDGSQKTFYTKDWEDAKKALLEGKNVIYSPFLSSLYYSCPPLSMRPVFWNAQMGPNWIRSLGLAVDVQHPLFHDFPTDSFGGWQWEDILARARGFHMAGMPEGLVPVVEAIDDWNRNYPLALIFECRVLNGNLLVVSADLEGEFAKRPAACSLKQAAFTYVESSEFHPTVEVAKDVIEKQLFSNHVMKALLAEPEVGSGVTVNGLPNLLDGNPNTSASFKKEDYPIEIMIRLKKAAPVSGLVYMPDQKDRMRFGNVKGYQVLAEEDGIWKNAGAGELSSSYEPQKIFFDREYQSKNIKFLILSGFLESEEEVWTEAYDGWVRVRQKREAFAEIAVLSLITNRKMAEDDERYWTAAKKSKTKEIDD